MASTWGWHDWPGDGRPSLRRPLPCTPEFGLVRRDCGNIGSVSEFMHPPYIGATMWRGVLEVGLWEGDGYRVGYKRNWADDSGCLYPDSDNLPDCWREPVAAAIAEVRERFPDHEILLRPRDDDQAA